jgi:photosystem II stability/assembly factor-like uncharacterized protein
VAGRFGVEGLEDRTLLSTTIPLSGTTWTPIGPAPVLNGGTPGNLPVAGRITGIAADPIDPNTIYIASAGGGVWKTTDGGNDWTPLTDHLTDSTGTPLPEFMGAIALAPSDPSVVYAGMGEANNAGDNFYGRGVLKSTDGGANWTLEGQFDEFGFPLFDRSTISKIVVSPSDPNTVYVAVAGSGVNGNVAATGIYETTDGGTTWFDTTASISTTASFCDLVIDPTTPTTLFAAVGSVAGDQANDVYETTDGGATWDPVFDPGILGVGRIAIAMAPSDPNVIYVSVAGSGQGGTNFGDVAAFLSTTDGGATWTDLTGNVPSYFGGGQFAAGWYNNALAVDPADPNIIYAGGSTNGGTPGIVASTDGGFTWLDIGADGNGDGPHTDHHAFAFDASGRLLDGNDGGLFAFDQTALTWSDLNGNLQTIQFTGIALDPTNANIAYGGSQDNGTEKFTDSAQWTSISGGDGGFVRVDPNNPNTIYHTFTRVSLQRSTDGGATFQNAIGTGSNAINSNDPTNFYSPFVIDPSNTSRLLFGTNVLYESLDQGNNWAPISTPGANGWNTNVPISAIAVAPSDGNTIYAATNDGRIFTTNNDGTSWTEIDIPTAGDKFANIVVDPRNSQVAYVVRNAFDDLVNAGKVFETTDGGNTWFDLTGNLPDLPTWSIALDPRSDPATLYVGNDVGVYFSTDGGNTWDRYKTGLPNAQVTSLELNTNLNILAAGTHGRGMFEVLATAVDLGVQVTATAPTGVVANVPLAAAQVATFIDNGNTEPLGNYTVTIDWGDGTPLDTTSGAVTQPGGPGTPFLVTGSHTYTQPTPADTPYTLIVTVNDLDGTPPGKDQAGVAVAEPSGGNPLIYNGGPELQNVAVETVYLGQDWGTADSQAEISRLDQFQGYITNSTYMDLLAEYSTNGFTVGHGTFVGHDIVAGTGAPTDGQQIDNTQIQAMLNTEIRAGKVQAPTPNRLYFVYVAPNVVITLGQDDSVNSFLGYHSEFTDSQGVEVFYAVIANPIGNATIPGTSDFQQQTEVSTHELAEAITDPSNPATAEAPGGWFDDSGQEVGDKCNAMISYLNGYAVQDEYSNAAGGCVLPAGATTTNPQTMSASVQSIQFLYNTKFTGTVATFSDPSQTTTAADYDVEIDWGDGTSSPGTIVSDPNVPGQFDVQGSHVYITTELGTDPDFLEASGSHGQGPPSNGPPPTTLTVTVVVVNIVTNGKITRHATATSGDAPLTTAGTIIKPTPGVPFTGTVATFTDADPNGSAAQFTATIDWGDKTTPSPGTVTPDPKGGFDVNGTHTYSAVGLFSISITITDSGGATAMEKSSAMLSGVPAATTEAATAITGTKATLKGSVNPEVSDTTVTFVYGTDATLSSGTTTTTAAQSIGSGTSAVAVTAPVTGLTPGTTYYYQVVATNPSGTVKGTIVSFTTPALPLPPAATTQAATTITNASATLTASVNPSNSATTVTFVYGTDATLTSGTTTTPAQSIGSGTSAVAVTAPVAGLTPGTTYFFQVVATNVGGTVKGTIVSFTTAAPAPASIQFTGSLFTVNATAGTAQVVVTRTGNPSATVTVVVSSPGGQDVAPFQQTVTFAPNTSSATVTVPIQNDGRPGESDVSIPLSLSSPGPGAILGAGASASLVVHDNNPFPPLVTVASLQPTAVPITIGTGRRKKTKSLPGLLLEFSGNLTGTDNPAAYQLIVGTTKRGRTTFKNVPFVVVSATPTSATLVLLGKLNLSQPELLRVTASALSDAFGRPLDGGQSFTTTFGNKVVTSARVKSQSRIGPLSAPAVDAVLSEGMMRTGVRLSKRR